MLTVLSVYLFIGLCLLICGWAGLYGPPTFIEMNWKIRFKTLLVIPFWLPMLGWVVVESVKEHRQNKRYDD